MKESLKAGEHVLLEGRIAVNRPLGNNVTASVVMEDAKRLGK
jgi:hypothetical protein